MKWWKKASIFSGVWLAFTIGAGIVHTNVILAGKITPEQDSIISEKYGELCGAGIVGIWALTYFRRKRAEKVQDKTNTTNPSEKKKPNYLLIAIGAALGAAVPAILSNTVFSPDAKIDKGLMQAASQINASCPIMVDKMTRLDNAIASPGKRFIYNYTVLAKIAVDFDPALFTKQLQPVLISHYKNTPECQSMFKHGVTVVCRYCQTNGTHLADIPITPKDCGY